MISMQCENQNLIRNEVLRYVNNKTWQKFNITSMFYFQIRLEALNQILELLSTEKDKEQIVDQEEGTSFWQTPSLSSTTLLDSVHVQFLAGWFGLYSSNTEVCNTPQLSHYENLSYLGDFCLERFVN